jgi:ABC-type multidrug transport system permease subunit
MARRAWRMHRGLLVLRELVAATKKNLLRLMRLRVSAAAILFGPLLLIVIIGLAFSNTKLHDITVGTYAQEKTEYVDNIIEKLGSADSTFLVVEYETEQSCIQSVKDGSSHICTTFKQKPDSTTEISFHVDYSRLSLVLILINAMNQHVSNEASAIGVDISRSLLERMQDVNKYVDENDDRLDGISEDSEEMLLGIRQMRADISRLDISNPLDAKALSNISGQAAGQKSAILQQQKTVKAEIASSRTQIRQTRIDLENSKKDLDASQVKMDQAILQIKASEDALQCGQVQVEDLSAYLEDRAGLEQKLASMTKPECSVLYTARKNIEGMQAQSQVAEKKLDAAIKQLTDAETQLDAFEKEYDKGSADAVSGIDAAQAQLAVMSLQLQQGNAKVAEIKTMQQSLGTQLADAESSMNSSTQSLAEIKRSLGGVKESLDGIDAITPEAIVKPFDTRIESVTGARRQFDFLFPSLLALVIMFVSILAASTIVMKEKGSRAYFRNLIMPAPTFIFFTGVVLTSIILALIQIVVIIFIGVVAFNIDLFSNFGLLVLSLLLSICFFSFLGLIYGFMFNSEETTTLISLISGVILFLFSSIIIPIESMDPALASIAHFNPFVLSEQLLRQSLLFNDAFPAGTVLLLVAETAILLAIAIFTIREARRNG